MDNEELEGVKFSEFPSQTPGNSDEVVGLHSGDNARFSIANIVAAVRQGLASIFVPLTRTINGKGLSTDISLDASDVGAVDTADVGVADGVASLDSTGKVPSTQLPPIVSTAADVTYDNTQSGLSADDVQEAIDELAQGGGGGTTVIANPAGSATDTLTKLQVENTIYSISGGGSGASEAQLAYVETGTTASQNYTAGQYIALNGLLYTADTAIASGATFYTSGGNKNLTECPGGGFNGLFATKAFTITIASIRLYNFIDSTSDVTVAGYVPIAVNTFDIDEDHCIIQKLGFTSGNINTLYYRIKNYDSSPVTNVTFVVRVLYARTSLIQL